jgi:hypothetical protein
MAWHGNMEPRRPKPKPSTETKNHVSPKASLKCKWNWAPCRVGIDRVEVRMQTRDHEVCCDDDARGCVVRIRIRRAGSRACIILCTYRIAPS